MLGHPSILYAVRYEVRIISRKDPEQSGNPQRLYATDPPRRMMIKSDPCSDAGASKPRRAKKLSCKQPAFVRLRRTTAGELSGSVRSDIFRVLTHHQRNNSSKFRPARMV
jgi:hypothetical protein